MLQILLLSLSVAWVPTATKANGLSGSILWSAEGRYEARPRSDRPLFLSSVDAPLLFASGNFEDPSRVWRISPTGTSAVEAQALEFPSTVADVISARKCADGRTLFIARSHSGAIGDSVGQLSADGTLRWIRAVADVFRLGNRTLFVSRSCDAIVSGELGGGVLQVWALDAETGLPRWARSVGASSETAGLVPQAVAFSTPDAVFVRVGSSTALMKLDAATGVTLWTRQYPTDTVLGQRSCPLATANAGRGYIACWRMDDTPGGRPAVVSVDASTGDIVWTAFDDGASAFSGQSPIDIAVEDGISIRLGERLWRVEVLDGATRWAATLPFGSVISTLPGGDVLVAEPPDGSVPAQLSKRSSGTGAIAWTRDVPASFVHSVAWTGTQAVVVSLDRPDGLFQFPYPRLAFFSLVDGTPTAELQPTASVADAVGVPVAVGSDHVVARTTLSGGAAQLVVERRDGSTGAVQWSRTLAWASAPINQGLSAPIIVLDASGILSIATSTYPRFADSAGARLQSSFVVAIAASDGTILGQLAMPPVSGFPLTRWFAVQQAQFLPPDGFVLVGTDGQYDGNANAITRQNVTKRRDVGSSVDRWSVGLGSFIVEDGDVIVHDTAPSQTVRLRRLDGDTGSLVWERTGVGSRLSFSLLRSTGAGDIVAAYWAQFGGPGSSIDVGVTRFAAADGAPYWTRQWVYAPNAGPHSVGGLQLVSPDTALVSVRAIGSMPSPVLLRFDTLTGDRVFESVEPIPAAWAASGGRIASRSATTVAMGYARWANANFQSNICGVCASALRMMNAQTGAVVGAHFTSNAGRFELSTADMPPLLAEGSSGPAAALRTIFDPMLGRRLVASGLLRPEAPIVGNASVQIESFDVSDDPYATTTMTIRIGFAGSPDPTRIELRGFQAAGSWVESVTCTSPRNACQLDPRTENLSGSVELADGETAELRVTIRQNPSAQSRGPFSIAVVPPFAVLDAAPQDNFASAVLQTELFDDSFESK